MPLRDYVAATSVGIVGGVPMLDLCYEEDSQADVDMNVVMTGAGHFVEVQATAEHRPFDDAQMAGLIALARGGIAQLDRDPEAGGRRFDPALLRHGQSGQAARVPDGRRGAPGGNRAAARLPGDPAVRGGWRHVRGERHHQGAALRAATLRACCSRTIRAWKWTRLSGAPGVFSARFAGPQASDEANNRLLIEKLSGVGEPYARASSAPSRWPRAAASGGCIVARWRGSSRRAARPGRFRLRPVILSPVLGCTFGEATDAQKFELSHRGQALRAMLADLFENRPLDARP